MPAAAPARVCRARRTFSARSLSVLATGAGISEATGVGALLEGRVSGIRVRHRDGGRGLGGAVRRGRGWRLGVGVRSHLWRFGCGFFGLRGWFGVIGVGRLEILEFAE